MSRIDPAILREIDSAIDNSLKKNKDIKAAADVEKNIDKYVSKNRISIENANKLAKLEVLVARMDKTLAAIDKAVSTNERARQALLNEISVLKGNQKELTWQVKQNAQEIKKLMSASRR